MSNPFNENEDEKLLAPVASSEVNLAELGMNHVAYVKAVIVNGVPGFTIHAADGTTVALAADKELAIAAVIQNDMMPVSLH